MLARKKYYVHCLGMKKNRNFATTKVRKSIVVSMVETLFIDGCDPIYCKKYDKAKCKY